jgi:hypothetical protein
MASSAPRSTSETMSVAEIFVSTPDTGAPETITPAAAWAASRAEEARSDNRTSTSPARRGPRANAAAALQASKWRVGEASGTSKC